MTVDWQEVDGMEWRDEFIKLKGTLTIEQINLLQSGANTMKEAWQLGALHAEYKRLKRNQPPDLPPIIN